VILLLHPDTRHLGLHIFSLAQLAFALVKSATYFAYFAWLFASSNGEDTTIESKLPPDFPFRKLRDFLPSTTKSTECHVTNPDANVTHSSHSLPLLPSIDPSLASLSWTLVKQTVVKQLLTEGERYVMTFFDALSFADQGVYDLVNNLGSLVVRFLFQPIEESGNVFFSRTLKRGGGGIGRVVEASTLAAGNGGNSGSPNETFSDDKPIIKGGIDPAPEEARSDGGEASKSRVTSVPTIDGGGLYGRDDDEDWMLASTVLRHLLRFVVHLGMLAVVFGQSYSHLALHVFGGTTLSTGIGPDLLRAYCFYVLVIAVNGTLEAFVTAVMKESEVDSYSRVMVAFSFAFVLATLVLTRLLGSFGFIFANCLNMMMRIGYCIMFVVNYCKMRDGEMADTMFRTNETELEGQVTDKDGRKIGTSPSIHPLFGLRTPPSCLIVYFAALLTTHVSEKWFYGVGASFRGVVLHIGVGGVAVVLTLVVVIWAEREMIDFARRNWAERKRK